MSHYLVQNTIRGHLNILTIDADAIIRHAVVSNNTKDRVTRLPSSQSYVSAIKSLSFCIYDIDDGQSPEAYRPAAALACPSTTS
jgi:hypothetical protein